jgi:hypothetical protein
MNPDPRPLARLLQKIEDRFWQMDDQIEQEWGVASYVGGLKVEKPEDEAIGWWREVNEILAAGVSVPEPAASTEPSPREIGDPLCRWCGSIIYRVDQPCPGSPPPRYCERLTAAGIEQLHPDPLNVIAAFLADFHGEVNDSAVQAASEYWPDAQRLIDKLRAAGSIRRPGGQVSGDEIAAIIRRAAELYPCRHCGGTGGGARMGWTTLCGHCRGSGIELHPDRAGSLLDAEDET